MLAFFELRYIPENAVHAHACLAEQSEELLESHVSSATPCLFRPPRTSAISYNPFTLAETGITIPPPLHH